MKLSNYYTASLAASKILLTLACALLLFVGSTFGLAEATNNYEPINPEGQGINSRRTPIVAAIEKAGPAVVSIYVQTHGRTGRGSFHDDFFDRFFNDMWQRRGRPDISLGSGVIIDGARGVLVTNEHVIRDAARITVTLSDGRELPAEILGADPAYDLAVLAVSSHSPLPQVTLGDSETLMIGETVIAIGNPFGLSHTATTGVVSALGRTVPGPGSEGGLKNLIQTDASINPGNSGGPLINVEGLLIGLNTAILARGEGLGFAIPAEHVRRITTSLLREPHDALAFDFGLELAEAGRPQKGENACLVIGVDPKGPAYSAGIRKGDMLLKLDGSSTTLISEYEMILRSLEPGTPVEAEIRREKQILVLTVTPRPITENEALELLWQFYGLKGEIEEGFVVLGAPRSNSPAATAGLRPGDVLLALGGLELKSQNDLAVAALKGRFKNEISLAAKRGRTIYRLTLRR
ncbi:MAG: trypsin-like peptidase domain-containing protein [Candidatus Adiutrix sp.]